VPSVIDQDINVADLLRKVFDIGRVAQIRGDEPSLTAGHLDLFDDRCAARGVASDNDDLQVVTGEPEGDLFAQACGCAGDECGQGLVVNRGHKVSPSDGTEQNLRPV